MVIEACSLISIWVIPASVPTIWNIILNTWFVKNVICVNICVCEKLHWFLYPNNNLYLKIRHKKPNLIYNIIHSEFIYTNCLEFRISYQWFLVEQNIRMFYKFDYIHQIKLTSGILSYTIIYINTYVEPITCHRQYYYFNIHTT